MASASPRVFQFVRSRAAMGNEIGQGSILLEVFCFIKIGHCPNGLLLGKRIAEPRAVVLERLSKIFRSRDEIEETAFVRMIFVIVGRLDYIV